MTGEIKRDAVETDAPATGARRPPRGRQGLEPAQTPRGRLKILFLAVDGDRAQKLELEEEFRSIDESVARRPDQLELVSKWAVRRRELQPSLLRHRPDIV